MALGSPVCEAQTPAAFFVLWGAEEQRLQLLVEGIKDHSRREVGNWISKGIC